MSRLAVAFFACCLVAAGCGDDGTATPTTSSSTTSSSTTSSTSTSTSSTSTTSSTTTTTTTEAPAPVCETDEALAVLDAALVDARFAPGGEWSTEVEGSAFVADSATPESWAEHLGFDCAVAVVQPDAPDDRFALISWIGPRMAFVVRSTGGPTAPYAQVASVSVGFEFPMGEFVRDDMTLWGGVLESGETVVVGHIDYSLGVTAKTWRFDAPAIGEGPVTLDSERAAIDALRAAGARNMTIAEPPMFESPEGYVSFISPTGQIGVVDVAPPDWFDPMRERYYHGETTFTDVDGVQVRVTQPGPDEGIYDQGVEVAWACGEFVWILQPTSNGTGEEQVAFVETLIAANDCAVG